VTPVEPGYTTWQVKPQPGTLAWAQGQVPTARGPLVVRWAQDTTGQFPLQVVAPAGTGGEVWVPLVSADATSASLAPGATFLRRDGTYDVYRVGAGTFEFSSALLAGHPLPEVGALDARVVAGHVDP
jgi:hypothetical protein